MIQNTNTAWGLSEVQTFARQPFDYEKPNDDFSKDVAKALYSSSHATSALLWKLDSSKKTVAYSSIQAPDQLAFDGSQGKKHLGLVWKSLNESVGEVMEAVPARDTQRTSDQPGGSPETDTAESFLLQHHQVFLPLKRPGVCDQVLVLFLDPKRFDTISQDHVRQLESQIELAFCAKNWPNGTPSRRTR